MSKTVIELTTPIEAHGETVSKLELREPAVEDITRLGDPYYFGTDKSIRLDSAVIAKYISRLAAIPESSVKMLSIRDFNTARGAVMDFFGDAAGVLPDTEI
jgi:hypothetical protein